MSAPRYHHSFHKWAAVLFILAVTALIASPLFIARSSRRSPAASTPPPPQAKRKQLQPDLPGTINGASDPASIPDRVAFELFMRSLGDYPSESAFKDFGLNADQVANVLSYAQSFEQVMSTMDRTGRVLRASGNNPKELAKLQKKKEDFISRNLNHDMPFLLGAGGGNKLSSHLLNRVKPKTKKIPGTFARNNPANDGDTKVERGTARRSHHAVTPMVGDGVYVYCNSWQDGDNVYGSGTLVSDYGDYNQYLVTTTVIAPDGSRYSTSQAGWDYPAVTDTGYLSFMPK